MASVPVSQQGSHSRLMPPNQEHPAGKTERRAAPWCWGDQPRGAALPPGMLSTGIAQPAEERWIKVRAELGDTMLSGRCAHRCGEAEPPGGCAGNPQPRTRCSPTAASQVALSEACSRSRHSASHCSFRLERFSQVPVRIVHWSSNSRYVCRSRGRFPCGITILAGILMHLDQQKVLPAYVSQRTGRSQATGAPPAGARWISARRVAGPALPCLAGAMLTL